MPNPPPSELETELLSAIRQFFEGRERSEVPDQGGETAVTSRKLQLAFADAELKGHEEYYVRKGAQSLHLSTADLIETKIRAPEAFLSSGG